MRIQSDDIILFHIIPALHFNQNQGRMAGVAEAMQVSHRDMRRLLRVKQVALAIMSHFGNTADDQPMFAAVVMKLQGGGFTRIDGELFHLISVFLAEHGIVPPGSHGGYR